MFYPEIIKCIQIARFTVVGNFAHSDTSVNCMLYVYLTLLIIVNAFWLCLTFFALPGNWLVVISTFAFAWWRGDDGVFSTFTLILITILACLGEIIEFFAGIGGAKKAGASWRGSVGAILGMIVGAIVGTVVIPLPFIGTLFGACCGAGVGAWALELAGGNEMHDSIKFGIGAGIGTLIGTGSKIAIGVFIFLIVVVAAFWP